MITETLCSNSHKPLVKGWPSKVLNRTFFVADDFSGYSRATLASLHKEIDQDIFLINKSIKETRQKKGMYRVILAVEAKYQRELGRVKQRRAFLVEVKEWITLALIKKKEESAVTSFKSHKLPAQEKISHSFVKHAEHSLNAWTKKLSSQSKYWSTIAFDKRVKEVLKALIIEELGSQYYNLCDKAISAVAAEANSYFSNLPDNKNNNQLINDINSHIDDLNSELMRKF